MAAGLTQRLTSSVVLMGVLFAVLVVSLYILSSTTENVDRFGQYYFWLLVADGFALLVMTYLITSNAWHLMREFRQRVAGSRLTVKLIVMSVFLSLVPVSLVYFFSIKFLRTNIDSFFDVKIEQALNDSLALSRDSLALQMRVMRRVTSDVAGQLEGIGEGDIVEALNSIGSRIEAEELTLLDGRNQVIASSSFTSELSVSPDRPADDLAERARSGIPYVGVDPIGDGDLVIRVVTPVLGGDPAKGNRVLQALYPVDGKSGELAVSVQESFQRYQQLVFLSRPLKLGAILTLSLTLLLSVLIALWFAFYAARRMMVPIHDLVEGTRQVADGDYSVRIYKHGDDELRYLVESFNDMTGRLERSNEIATLSREHLESQRAYLETVLRHVSTGVVTLELDGLLRTANDAAINILGDALADCIGKQLDQTELASSVVKQFYELNRAFIERGRDWSQDIEVFQKQGRRLLLCRGAQLHDPAGNIAGVVIVFDDMTDIVQAQRNEAWSEVARRLAHEIKNPLTPIQLSAERLRRKYLAKMQGDDAELLDRLTHTIVQQVDAMQSMVKAFAEYANTPAAHFKRTDINQLILEVVDLYRDVDDKVALSVQLGTNLPSISADATRIRQLLHNLLKNALEAQKDGTRPFILISTRIVMRDDSRVLELRVEDHGPGIPVDLLDKLFEPYVTSKPKGTGLGLAIVKKIVEEHNGRVFAENTENGGGCIVMHLPLNTHVPPLELYVNE
ncbi:MAG TPA: two-component sensor histidine kinase [Gammaproteobacteria bacterium]|jgi:PAS domain S-box-containing protein|nr:two-component sensor histidine kinase [Gammaproteobacteria bacterium]